MYPNDLEVTKQWVSSEVPLCFSSLLALPISLCWSFLVVCNTNCKYFNATTVFTWHPRPRHVSPPYICKCHRIQTKAVFCNTDHTYIFIYILLGKSKSILLALNCFVCKYGLPHLQHKLKDDPLMKSHWHCQTLSHENLIQEKDFCLPMLCCELECIQFKTRIIDAEF